MYSAHSTRDGVGLDGLFRPGDHACQFFRSGDELGEVLVPYFKTGLERNELCVWVTAPPYGRDRATSELRAAVADFDRRAAAGQISILGHEEWYGQQATATVAERIETALAVKDKAIAAGYAGLRGSGNTSMLAKETWHEFMAYERATTELFKSQPMTGLCSYGFDQCSARGVVDVLHCHGHGLAKRHGQWGLLEVRPHDGVQAIRHSHAAGPARRRREELRRIIEDQLAVFIGACPERIALKGARVDLSVRQATRLAILLSELTTNAARYGALASAAGKVAVQWHVVANGSRKLHVAWTESGAVNLTVPETIGSGTQLMASMESCTRLFSPTGMACELELRLDD
jgi:hypothetical protein